MACHFILRSPYLPSNRLVKKLDAETPLAWFQSIWPRLKADPAPNSEELLGVDDLYGFAGFVDRVREEDLAPPVDNGTLETLLSHKWYSNEIEVRDGFAYVLTDDDEVELAFWWVSEAVFADEADLFTIYATDVLPDDAGEGPGNRAVHAAFSTVWDSGNLTDSPGPFLLEGVRLPDLARYLVALPPDDDRPLELDWLALIARAHPRLDLPALLRRLADVSPSTADSHCEAIKAKTLTEEELRSNVRWLSDRKRTVQVQGGAHCVELRFDDGFNHHVWFLFDDLWATAHPVLARSILRFAEPFDL